MKYLIISFILLFAISCYADEISDLILIIVKIESNGNPNAISEDGCIGLCQISKDVLNEYNSEHSWSREGKWASGSTVAYYKTYGFNDLFNPEINVFIGEWYLRRLKDHYLKEHYTIERMLAAYNGGITRLKQVNYNIEKMPYETRQYVKKVMVIYEKAKK